MRSNASKSRKATFVAAGTVAVAVFGAAWAHAQVAPAATATAVSDSPKAATQGASPAPVHPFPNVVLKTHEGKNVRFYDDLLKGKIVLINFMYADCKKR